MSRSKPTQTDLVGSAATVQVNLGRLRDEKPDDTKPVLMDAVDSILQERGEVYESVFPTWYEHGDFIADLESKYPGWMHILQLSGYSANWMHCLGKLLRAANEPNNSEHWLDLEGYARLVRQHIAKREAEAWHTK